MLIQFATITDMNVFYMKKKGSGFFFIWKEDIVLLIYKYPFTKNEKEKNRCVKFCVHFIQTEV